MAQKQKLDCHQLEPLPLHLFIQSLGNGLSWNLSDSSAALSTLADLGVDCQLLANMPLSYAPMAGDERLRSAIASMYRDISAEEVIVFCGAQEAIFATQLAILQSGDEVVVIGPGYPTLTRTVASMKIQFKTLEVQSDPWRFDIRQLPALLSPRTRLMVVNSPHNPTGAVLAKDDAKALCSQAEFLGIPLLSDEVGTFSHDPAAPEPMRMCEHSQQAMSLGVLSKSFGLPGIRIGWLVVRNQQWREKLMQAKGYLSICPSRLDQMVATELFSRSGPLLERNNKIRFENIASALALCKKYPLQVECSRPAAGLTGVVKLLMEDPFEHARKVAQQEQMLAFPAALFGVKGPWLRVGFGSARFPEILKRWERCLQ